MGAFTYLSDSEVSRMTTVNDDKELNELLQEVRQAFGPVWFVEVRVSMAQAKKHFWSRHRDLKPPVKYYTVYFYNGGGIEYQIINLATENGHGSVFTAGTRSGVMNYFFGMLSGHHYASGKNQV